MSDAKVNPLQFTWRLYLVYFVMLAGITAVLWKVATLHVVQRDFLQEQGDARTIRVEPLMAHRGMIMDRNGEPLAVSTPVKSIWVNPREIGENRDGMAQLAQHLEIDEKTLLDTVISNSNKEFIYAKRRLPPQQADEILALGIPGVYSRQEYQRYYPQGEVTAHVVGFSNIDDIGQEGLELAYDHWLQGIPGKQQVIKDRRGRIIKELNTLQTAQPGKNLELSIDFRIQNLAYRELKAEFINRGARSASAVVLNVESGEVLAMVNQPSYNPNNRSRISDFGVLRNRAITDQQEPGSTAKTFTAIAALESGLYTPGTTIDTSPGRLRVGRDYVEDRGRDYGVLTVAEVVAKSSNIGSAKIALSIGPDLLRDVMARAGFGENTGSGFPGERGGILPSHRRWSDIELATLSFGYGLTASTLQIAQAYSVIASDGIKRPVTLLKHSGSIDSIPEERVFDAEVVRQVKAMLEAVVDPEKGGATAANVPFYSVAGKTGTAQVLGEGGYLLKVNNSSFAGYAPAHNPKIVVVVVINEPQGSQQFGSQVAAPVFSRIVAGTMRILEIAPDNLDSDHVLRLSAL
ncbi:MAG: penicillin-binding protein 2 [Pseudomonadales bacterium]|nr:penicillin-binding protein 2 [Pseudomonadales bacterium]